MIGRRCGRGLYVGIGVEKENIYDGGKQLFNLIEKIGRVKRNNDDARKM